MAYIGCGYDINLLLQTFIELRPVKNILEGCIQIKI